MVYNLNNVKDFKYLTKENILDLLYEEDIFAFYLNESVDLKKEYISPFRTDNVPTCSFFKGRNDRLLFIDFGSNSSVCDCFEFVQKIFNISFFECLKKINTDFRLNLGNNSLNEHYYSQRIYDKDYIQKKLDYIKPPKLLVKTRKWQTFDTVYWGKYGITQTLLKVFNVYPVQTVFLDTRIIWRNVETNPIYCYRFKEGMKKIYRPYETNKKYKFLSSQNISSIYQGEEQLPLQGDLLIITKSLKDVMVFRHLGFLAIAPNSESYIIPEKDMQRFKDRFKEIFIFYDNDKAGIEGAYVNAAKYNLSYDYIKSQDSYNKEVKDISDFYYTYSRGSTVNLINKKLKQHGYRF